MEIKVAKNKIESLEQYSRRNCLIFHGLPYNENENTDK